MQPPPPPPPPSHHCSIGMTLYVILLCTDLRGNSSFNEFVKEAAGITWREQEWATIENFTYSNIALAGQTLDYVRRTNFTGITVSE